MVPRPSRFRPDSLGGALDEYAEGAILYLYLENFVTYERCEVYPGPHMNMLMGPNGTGKSSIVAAMVLGLGWSPHLLGRSKEVAQYIRTGSSHAVIETTLRTGALREEGDEDDVSGDAGVPEVEREEDSGYVVIRREIAMRTNGGPTSDWFVNGQPSSARTVSRIVRALNVQVDNLCQFLPQDKVSEFAKLKPEELLLETEKAAAGDQVYEQHRKLVEHRREELALNSAIEAKKKDLAGLEKRNENIAELIQRFEEREEYLRTIKHCEAKRPWLRYKAAQEKHREARERSVTLRAQLEQAEEVAGPLKRQLRAVEGALKAEEKKRAAIDAEADKLRRQLGEIVEDEIPDLSEEISSLRTGILKLREDRAKRDAEIAELRGVIRSLEQEINQADEHSDVADAIRQELGAVNRSISAVEAQVAEADGEIRPYTIEGDKLNREIERFSAELRQLEDVRAQRLDLVRKMSDHVYRTHEWIKANRTKFREQPYGPICLEMNVKEAALAKHVESTISRGTLLNFVVTNDDDYEVFREACRQNKWESNVIIMESIDVEWARAAIDRTQLKSLGFQGTVLDIVDAPDAVLAALVDIAKIHGIPVAKGKVNAEAVEPVRSITKYADADGCYEIRRSQYDNECATRWSSFKEAQFFRHSDQEKDSVVARIAKCNDQLRQNQERLRRIYQDQSGLRQQLSSLHRQRDAINDRQREILNAVHEVKKKRQQLETKKSNLRKLTSESRRDAAAKEEELKDELRATIGRQADLALKGARLAAEYKEVSMRIVVASVANSQLQWEIDRIAEEIRASDAKFEEMRQAVAEAERRTQELKQIAKDLLPRQTVEPDLQEAFDRLPDTIEELETVLAVHRAKVELTEDSDVSIATRREYERRAVEIARLQGETEELRAECERKQSLMGELRTLWLPAVQAMAALINERFSDFFARMGCVGQVQLAEKGSDYADYALEILVKFRDADPLAVLSATRQSGGEKSVSTILYLLALQELAKSPFRVVDEINQGMDANNERRVHALIVETATRAARSQYAGTRFVDDCRYFLITPKLLTGLAYHERMHVLCVFNGEGVPPI